MPAYPDGSSRDDILIDAAVRQFEAARALHNAAQDSRRSGFGLDVRQPSLGSEALAGYVLLRELHRGGQGVVYEALQKATKRKVAIKVLHESTTSAAASRRRFELEIAILSQLRHANIVTVHDSGEAGGRFFYVMDLVPGVPLDHWLEKRRGERRADSVRSGTRAALRAELDEILELFIKICDAVNAAHLRGVIHRDLKPGNILVDGAGEPHVLDFGLAKYTLGMPDEPSAAPTMTQAGQFVGSLPWSSPEQAGGGAEMDIRSDVYAFGVLLYHALTGQFPYRVVGDPLDVLAQIRNADPRPMNDARRSHGAGAPTGLTQEIDNEVETIVRKCLQKDRERRYQTAGDLGRDLQHYLKHEPIEAKRDSLGYILRKQLRRYRWVVGVAAGFIVILVAGLLTSLALWRASEEQRGVATHERDKAVKAQVAADQRRAESDAVTRLLQDLLTAANPMNEPNPNVTVREMLDAFDKKRADALRDQPAVELRVRLVTGQAYRGLAQFEQSEVQLQRAIELARALRGPDSDEANEAQLELALLRRDETRYSEALGILNQVRASLVRTNSSHGLLLVRADQVLAEIHYHMGEFKAGLEAVERALPYADQFPVDDASLPGSLLHTKANLVEQLSGREASIPLMQAALASYEKVYPPDHPELAVSRIDLADTYMLLGRLDEAAPLLEAADQSLTRTLGPGHPRVIYLHDRQAELFAARGEVDRAVELMRATIVERRKLGRESLAQGLNNLGDLLNTLGKADEAAPILEESVEIGRATTPEGSIKLATSLNNLAKTRFLQKRLDEAEDMLREALTIDEKYLPPQHESVLSDVRGLAYVCEARGKLADAIAAWRRVIAIREAAPQPDAAALAANKLKLADALVNHSRGLLDAGQTAEAEPLIAESVELRQKLLPPDSWRIYSAAGMLGECQMKLARLDEAQQTLQRAYDGLKSCADVPPDRMREAIGRLIAVCTERGQAADAARWQALLPQPASAP